VEGVEINNIQEVGKMTSEGWMCTIGDSVWLFPPKGPARKLGHIEKAAIEAGRNHAESERPGGGLVENRIKTERTENTPAFELVDSDEESASLKIEPDSRAENGQLTNKQSFTQESLQKQNTYNRSLASESSSAIVERKKSLPVPSVTTFRNVSKVDKAEVILSWWTTMIGGALWVFPPKAAARRATPEEIKLLAESKRVGSDSKIPNSHPTMTSLLSSEGRNSSEDSPAHRQSQDSANTDRGWRCSDQFENDRKPSTFSHLGKRTRETVSKTDTKNQVNGIETKLGWICKIGQNMWVFPEFGAARKLAPDELPFGAANIVPNELLAGKAKKMRKKALPPPFKGWDNSSNYRKSTPTKGKTRRVLPPRPRIPNSRSFKRTTPVLVKSENTKERQPATHPSRSILRRSREESGGRKTSLFGHNNQSDANNDPRVLCRPFVPKTEEFGWSKSRVDQPSYRAPEAFASGTYGSNNILSQQPVEGHNNNKSWSRSHVGKVEWAKPPTACEYSSVSRSANLVKSEELSRITTWSSATSSNRNDPEQKAASYQNQSPIDLRQTPNWLAYGVASSKQDEANSFRSQAQISNHKTVWGSSQTGLHEHRSQRRRIGDPASSSLS